MAAEADAPTEVPAGWSVLAVTSVLGLAARLWVQAGAAPLLWNDSADYRQAATAPLLSLERIAGTRPVLMPTVLWAAGSDLDRFVTAQQVVAAVSWALLATVVATSVTGWPRRCGAAAAMFAFSLVWPITMWDQQVLTESLAMSTFALVVAAGIWFAREPSAVSSGLLVAASAAWMLARDSHVLPMALVGVGLLVVAWRRWAGPFRLMLMTGAFLLAVAFLVGAASQEGQRNAVPMEHVYQSRVLPYPERVDWFADHGMPDAEALREVPAWPAGQGLAEYTPLGADARWNRWRAWVATDGSTTFARYVATHPSYVWSEPLQTPERVFNNGDGIAGYRPLDLHAFRFLTTVLYPPVGWTLLIGMLAAAALVVRRVPWSPLCTVAVITVVTAGPHALAVWHSDGMETARHLLLPGIQLRTGVLLLVIAVVVGRPAPGPGRVASRQT